MKKKNVFGRIALIIFLLILVAAAVLYLKINNSRQYEETFLSSETGKYEFKDIVTYNTSTHIAHVEVPRDALGGFVRDIFEDIELPDDMTIGRIGLTLNDDRTISLIPEIRYRNLVATCPVITVSFDIKEDHIDFIYEGADLAGIGISKLIDNMGGLKTGDIVASVDFPDIIMDFHQCPFMVKYVSNIKCDEDKISCDYDIYHATLELYKTDASTGEDNPYFQESIFQLKNLEYRGYKIVGD